MQKPWYRKVWDWRPRSRDSMIKEIDFLKAEVVIATSWTDLERRKAMQLEKRLDNIIGSKEHLV